MIGIWWSKVMFIISMEENFSRYCFELKIFSELTILKYVIWGIVISVKNITDLRKGFQFAIWEFLGISSMYYYSLSHIINPNFRPVYGIDLRFESLIKNTVFITFLWLVSILVNLLVLEIKRRLYVI